MFSDLDRLRWRNSLSYLTCYLFSVLSSTSLVLTWLFHSTNAVDQHPLETGPPLLLVTQLSPGLLLTLFLWQTAKPKTLGSWACHLSPLCLSTLIHTYSCNAFWDQKTHIFMLPWVFLSWRSKTRSSRACFSLQYLRVPQMWLMLAFSWVQIKYFASQRLLCTCTFSLFLPPMSKFEPLVS